MIKKVTNRDYESTTSSAVELPGGENVRLTYNRGISLNYGEVKADVAYSADFPADEVDTAFGKVKAWVDAKLKEAIKNKVG